MLSFTVRALGSSCAFRYWVLSGDSAGINSIYVCAGGGIRTSVGIKSEVISTIHQFYVVSDYQAFYLGELTRYMELTSHPLQQHIAATWTLGISTDR